LLLFFAVIWIALMGGYRGTTVTLMLTLFFLFWFEGLFRTRMLPILVLCGVLAAAICLPFTNRMPLMVQRSLSLLPLDINPAIRLNAEYSSEWRLRMWKEVLPTVPQYLLIGKGYSIDARELEAAATLAEYNSDAAAAGAALASDFHNGPLSLIIPLGAFGALAFLWFLIAGFRVLLNNYKYGDPRHLRINSFLLAYFATRTVFFLFVYGSFQNDLALFTGVVGLSAAVNGGMRQPEKNIVPKTNPAYLPFRLPKTAKA
jgi:O-antigen ligase